MGMEFIVNKRGVGKTLKQWAALGFVPKRGRKGELRFANRGDIAKGKKPELYFDPADVKEDKEAAKYLLNKLEQPDKPYNIRGFIIDELMKQGKRPKRGYLGHKRKKWMGVLDKESNYDWYWDPEEIENGDLFATRYGRELYKMHQNRTYNRLGKTLNQWLKDGYIPKKGHNGHERYRSETHLAYVAGVDSTAIYYDEDEVRFDREAAVKLSRDLSKQKRDEREAEKRKRKERAEAALLFRENMKTRYQWAQAGRVANPGAAFKWGSTLNEFIKNDDVERFGSEYKYCHLDDTRQATSDEMAVWDEFFRFEKEGHTCFRDIRGKLIDLCPEYQSDRESLLKIWEREMNGIWY